MGLSGGQTKLDFDQIVELPHRKRYENTSGPPLHLLCSGSQMDQNLI